MLGGVGKSCLTGMSAQPPNHNIQKAYCLPPKAQFVQNVWIESYDPTIEDSYRKAIEVDVSAKKGKI
jgi:hypothetical protein